LPIHGVTQVKALENLRNLDFEGVERVLLGKDFQACLVLLGGAPVRKLSSAERKNDRKNKDQNFHYKVIRKNKLKMSSNSEIDKKLKKLLNFVLEFDKSVPFRLSKLVLASNFEGTAVLE
jgi:hypothetical protein